MIIECLASAAIGASLVFLMCQSGSDSLPSLQSFRSLSSAPRRKGRVTIWTHEPMTEQQLRNALSAVTMADPLLRAVLQVLQENIDNAISEVGAVAIADKPGVLAHTAGGVEWLQFLQGDLADLMTDNQRRQFKPSSAGARTEDKDQD